MTGDYNWTLLRLFSSLTNRIFVASALLAVVSIALGIYNVNVAVTRQAEQELLRGPGRGADLIEENRQIQVEHFTVQARLIADLPRLKAAVGEADRHTRRGVVEEYQQELSADLFMVTDRHGGVLAGLAAEGPDGRRPVERLSGVPGGRRQGDELVCRAIPAASSSWSRCRSGSAPPTRRRFSARSASGSA